MAWKNWNVRSSLCILLLFVATHSEESSVNNDPNPKYILERKRNDSSLIYRINPNYIEEVTNVPTTTSKPRDEIIGCPQEFEGIPVCQVIQGELTQLRNTSCWFTKPRGLTQDMVVVKIVLYSVLVVVSILGNFYIIGAGLCDWYLSKQALCQGMVGLAFTDLFIVMWYYTEDLLTAKFPIDGYTPIGEVGCICRDMIMNILFAVNLFIIVIMFYERKHDAVVAENKFNIFTRQQSNMQRQISAGSSHVSSQGVLINGGPQISPLGTPAINPQYADAFVFPEDETADADIENVSIPCCSTSKMRLNGVTTRQMSTLILIAVVVSFVRGILFANMIQYNLCAFADGTHFPTCEPDKLSNWNRLWVFLGDVGIVYIGSIVMVCYFARKIFYQLHMPYHHGKHIAGYPDRSKKFLLLGAVAAFTYTFLLPERASFIFVKVSKVSFDMITNIILRMLIYLNCAFKPLLYGLMYHELYYPLKIRITGSPDIRKVTHVPVPPLDSILCEEPKMTEEERAELDRAVADEDQTKPSEAIIKMLREKVQEKKRRETERLSSLGSSNNSVLMRQGSDISNNGSGLCMPYAGSAFNGGVLHPAMNQYMQRSLSCNNAPYPYMGRPKLPSVSGPRDPCFQQSLTRNQQLGIPNFYTTGRGLERGFISKNGYHLAGNFGTGTGMGMNDTPDSSKYLLKNGSAEIPYYSQQNLYSTSPRKPRKNKEAVAAASHGYENNPLNHNGKRLKTPENGNIQGPITQSPSKRNKDTSNLNVPSLTAINGSPTTEECPSPPSPFLMDGTNGKEMGEERSSSSSNGSGCTEMTSISVGSLASGPRNSRRLSSSGSAQSSSPTPPTLPPRSPTGVHMFETITEQSPFDFSTSAIC